MDANVWNNICKIFAENCKTGEFTLSSGKKSDFYINLRSPLGYADALRELGSSLTGFAQQTDANVYAGPAAAALPLMTAAMLDPSTDCRIFGDDRELKMCYTRSSKKKHGLKNQVEGPELLEKDRVILVDDVLTTGGSLIRCGEALLETYPCKIVGIWVAVDRCEGGKEALKARFPDLFGVTSIFRKEHLLELMEAERSSGARSDN